MKITLLLKNKFFLASQHIFFGLTLAGLFPFLKNYLDVSAISQIGIFLSLGLMGQVFVNYCFQITGQTFIKKQNISYFLTNDFCNIFYTKVTLYFGFVVGFIFFIFFFNNKTYNIYLYLLLLFLPLCSVFNFTWVFYRVNQFKFLFYLSLLTLILQILCLYFYQKSPSYIFIILFLIFPYFIPQIITFIILYKKATYKNYSLNRVMMIITRGREIFLSQVVSIFYGLGGIIFIKIFSNDQQVTDYLVVEKFFAPIISFSLLVIPASFPTMIDSFNKKSFKPLMRTIKFTFLVFGIFFLGFLILFFLFDEQLKYYFFKQIPDSLKLSYFLIFLVSFFGSCFTYILSLKKEYIFLRNINLIILIFLFISGPISITKIGAEGWVYSYFIIHLLIFSFCAKRTFFFK
jgi:O-antigen/teichoic acid export membrane protein